MPYHTFFLLASGLAASIWTPPGTKAGIMAHIEEVERALGLKRDQYEENPIHWDHWNRDFSQIPDDVLCSTVSDHNNWVRQCYGDFAKWSEKPVENGEEITPQDAEGFWFGFEMLSVPPSRWTEDYYRERMETLYEVMRGRETQGVSFGARPISAKQAAAVVTLFPEFLDTHDIRLDVPNGHDILASSHDGGYEWCEKCGPVDPDDLWKCKKRKCPLKMEDQW